MAKNENYFIIRLVSLTAGHDGGKRGINNQQVDKLIELMSEYGRVYINTEKGKEIREDLKKYLINVSPMDFQNAIYFADMYVGDSQTVASEAGLMGVPTFRCNDFVGKVAYLEEEQDYGLIFNYKPEQFDEMLKKIKETLEMKNRKDRVEAGLN